MKITLYTVSNCQFSKQEKDYLASHNLQYEEKNLETNRDFLTEMMAISNNFAGTPVTKIEKDDGQIAVLKGFTKTEFDQALSLGVPASNPQPVIEQAENRVNIPPPKEPIQVSPPPAPVAPTPPPVQEPMPTAPVYAPAVEPVNEAPAAPTSPPIIELAPPQVDVPPQPVAPSTPASPTMPGNLPNIPDFKDQTTAS